MDKKQEQLLAKILDFLMPILVNVEDVSIAIEEFAKLYPNLKNSSMTELIDFQIHITDIIDTVNKARLSLINIHELETRTMN